MFPLVRLKCVDLDDVIHAAHTLERTYCGLTGEITPTPPKDLVEVTRKLCSKCMHGMILERGGEGSVHNNRNE